MRVCNRRVKEGAEDEVSLALSAGYLHTAPDLLLHLSDCLSIFSSCFNTCSLTPTSVFLLRPCLYLTVPGTKVPAARARVPVLSFIRPSVSYPIYMAQPIALRWPVLAIAALWRDCTSERSSLIVLNL